MVCFQRVLTESCGAMGSPRPVSLWRYEVSSSQAPLTVCTLPFLVFGQVSCTSDALLPVVLINTGLINSKAKEIKLCSMTNKNPESDIGVQAEDQESKTVRPLEKSYFYQVWATAD